LPTESPLRQDKSKKQGSEGPDPSEPDTFGSDVDGPPKIEKLNMDIWRALLNTP
jgi:hypothetical protein